MSTAKHSAVAAIGLATALLISGAQPSTAVSARDLMEKMSKQERFSYLTGLIDMRAYQAAQSGDAALPKCIYDAYYRDIGDNGDAWARLYEALVKYPDRQPATIVVLLVQKACSH